LDELLDILDADGNYTGMTAMKSEAHAKGLFHPTVHIWFYTKNKEVLLQQRGKEKSIFPLLWDVSVAGHIGAGENNEISALREIEEEIGIVVTKDKLQKIGIFKSEHKHTNGLLDYEFHHTYICELKCSINKLTKQKSEVEDLILTPLSVFQEQLQNPVTAKKYVPHATAYYNTIINAIYKQLL